MLRSEYFSGLSGAEWHAKLDESLDAVSLNPGDVLGKYPHQLSGGQLQRMLIARALMLDIRLLVADEIISMLDASTRIDVLNLLGDLKSRGLGILFITHDLSLGNYISDKTMILLRGAVVEMGAKMERRCCTPDRPTRKRRFASPPLSCRSGEGGERKGADAPAGRGRGARRPRPRARGGRATLAEEALGTTFLVGRRRLSGRPGVGPGRGRMGRFGIHAGVARSAPSGVRPLACPLRTASAGGAQRTAGSRGPAGAGDRVAEPRPRRPRPGPGPGRV